MTERHAPGEALDEVARIDHVLSLDQRKLLRHAPFADLGFNVERERRHVASFLRADHLPRFADDLAVRRMFLARDHIGVSAERQAEKISAQRHEHRRGHLRRLLVLPRADVVRLHRPGAVAEKADRRHVAPKLRDGEFDLLRGDDHAGLGVDGALLRFGGGGSGGGGGDEGEVHDNGFREVHKRGV